MGEKQAAILSVVEEIESLATYYEAIIEEKEAEINELTSITNDMQARIIRLEFENKKAKSTINKIRKQEINTGSISDVSSKQENLLKKDKVVDVKPTAITVKDITNYTVLDDILNDGLMEEKAILFLEYLLQTLEGKDIEAFEVGLHKSIEHIDIFTYTNDEITKLLHSFFVRLFKNEEKFVSVDYDQSFILALNFMTKLVDTPLSSIVTSFMETSFNDLLENIMHTNYLKIIIPFLRMCYTYKVNELLKQALLQIIQEDWSFIESDLTEEDMTLIFWYAYLTGLDYDLSSILTEENVKELEKKKEYGLYFYVYDSEHDLLIPEHTEYINHKKSFYKVRGLTEIEKKHVFQKTDEIIHLVINEHDFKWPSTDINEIRHKERETEFTLKQESELRSFGYKITGLNRMKRWSILEKAVPALGLSRVAYTIAHHIKLRKTQENGLIKFKHSITEWEHDLARLKKVYYKNNFSWPSTNLSI